jgi:hypothetical protein
LNSFSQVLEINHKEGEEEVTDQAADCKTPEIELGGERGLVSTLAGSARHLDFLSLSQTCRSPNLFQEMTPLSQEVPLISLIEDGEYTELGKEITHGMYMAEMPESIGPTKTTALLRKANDKYFDTQSKTAVKSVNSTEYIEFFSFYLTALLQKQEKISYQFICFCLDGILCTVVDGDPLPDFLFQHSNAAINDVVRVCKQSFIFTYSKQPDMYLENKEPYDLGTINVRWRSNSTELALWSIKCKWAMVVCGFRLKNTNPNKK